MSAKLFASSRKVKFGFKTGVEILNVKNSVFLQNFKYQIQFLSSFEFFLVPSTAFCPVFRVVGPQLCRRTFFQIAFQNDEAELTWQRTKCCHLLHSSIPMTFRDL